MLFVASATESLSLFLTKMSETWLQKLIASHDISKDTYTEIFNTVSSTRSDMAEKCEQLELLFCDLDETERETLVRKVLELLDERGIDSLLNPENHSQNLRKQKETSTIESKDFDENLEKYIISHIDTMDLNQTEDSKELEPIELLHSIFSDVGVEKLHYSLASCNYDIEKTIQYLLGDKPEQEPVSKQICRHFMAGECYRSDCWFSHNIDALVCKFWLSGSCYKGDKCEFSHGQNLGEISKLRRQSESSSARSSATSRATEPPKLEDFPQLGNVPKPKINFLSPTKPFNATLKAAKPTQSPTLERKVASMQSNYGREKLDMKWVSTGNTLNTSYITHRQDAINCAVERNKLFQKYHYLT